MHAALRCSFSFALALALGACSFGSPKADQEDKPDAAPIRVKTPSSDDKSGTAPECDGVTEHGVCEDGAAVVCDVASGELRRTDCEALGQTCVVDTSTGASCQEAGDTTCDSGLDFRGTCDGDVARWCDAEGEKSWDCAADGLSCQVDVCEDGAFCCGESGGGGETDPECEELGYLGECGGETGQTARYCNEGELVELACDSDPEYSCQIDACADGAYCCPGELECEELGFEGACAGNTVRYCNPDGEYEELNCTDFGMVCGTECNADGTDCCDLTCEEAGAEGVCIGDHLVYCDGDELIKVNCPEEYPETPNCIPEGDFGVPECGE